MGLLERILFWVAIFILLVAIIGERSKISALAKQAEKAKTINVIYQGEDEGEDEDSDEGEDEDSDEGDEGENEDGGEGEDDNGGDDTEENNGGEG